MKLDILLEKPKEKTLKIVFISTLIAFFVLFLIAFPLFNNVFPIGTKLTDVKNAWTKANMDAIIAEWASNPRPLLDLMILLHVVDFFFMAVYGLLLASGLILVARKLAGSEKLQKFYLIAFNCSWLAVLLDVLEGVFLYSIFFNTSNYSELSVIGANLSALLCLVFFYPGLILLLVGIIIAFLKNRK